MRGFRRYIIILPVLMYFHFSFAQSRRELELERMRIIDKIEMTTSILKQTENDKSKVLDRLLALKAQISNRNKIIDNLHSQIAGLNADMEVKKKYLDSLRREKMSLMQKYNTILRKSYIRSLSKNKLVFLFSAKDWENFLDRKRYLRQYNDFIKKRLREIQMRQNAIDSTLLSIESDKREMEKLLANEQENIVKLNQESQEKDKLLKKLKKNEAKLLKLLRKQKRQREIFNRHIEKIILSQLADNENLSTPNTAATRSFANFKGMLDMPVDNGYVISKFGKHRHPGIKGVYVFNDGIDIRTYPYAEVKAVFDGKVVGLMHITGYNWMLILKHGDYYTVYSKLSKVKVSKGDTVTRGTVLGTAGQEGQVHFGIWHNKKKLDPEKWLKK